MTAVSNRATRSFRALTFFTSALALSSCVPRERWDELVATEGQEKAAADRDRLEAVDARLSNERTISSLSVALTGSEGRNEHFQTELSTAETNKHNMQAALDESTAIGEQLRRELTHLGKDVNKLLSDKGTLASALENAKSRLTELRKVEEANEAQKALFRTFEERLKPLIEAKQVRIEGNASTGGHPVLVLDGDLVFNDEKSDIRSAGRGAVLEVARLLSDTKGEHYFVTVFSDEKVAKGKPVPWELSAARSVTLVRQLIAQHVPPESLTSGGAISTVVAGKPQKTESDTDTWPRRIEIAVVPTLAP